MSFSAHLSPGEPPVFGPADAAAVPARAGFVATPFGRAFLAGDADVLHWLSFPESRDEKVAWREGMAIFPDAAIRRDDAWASTLASPWFVRSRPVGKSPRVRLVLRGTDFQESVWRALLSIPPGTTRTYGELAASLGRPTAARAVGSAVGRNPIAWIIPCHRVVPATGGPGGYRWGSRCKNAMLAWEAAG